MSKGLNVLSLFDGMSCGNIAFKKANIPINKYYASEIDKYAIEIANKNNNIIQLGSVLDLDTEYIKTLNIDILIGGSPCQGFSMAGKMKGSSTVSGIDVTTLEQYLDLKAKGFQFNGQSYLFWEYIRVLKAIKPKYFLLENVKITKKWIDMFNDSVGCTPYKINSKLFTPHNRERYYWTNIPIQEIQDKNPSVLDIIDNSIKHKYHTKVIHHKEKALQTINDMENNEIRCCHTSNSKNFGNSVGDKIAYCLRVSHTNGIVQKINDKVVYRDFTPLECERLQGVPDNYTEGVSNTQRIHMLGNGWTVDVIAHIFKGII